MGMFILVLLILLILVILFLLLRTLRCRDNSEPVQPDAPLQAELMPAADNLIRAIQYQTISGGDDSCFEAFGRWLEETYPLIHTHLSFTKGEGWTRIYCWEGFDPSLEPVLLTAHQDVVPPGDPEDWDHPPFSGYRSDGYIWGRGAVDMKVQLVSLMESLELLLRRGFTPKRTVWIVLGHDEEIGGTGARAAASFFASRGITFFLLLDEGGCVTHGVMPGVDKPIAMVGTAEKGYADIELEAHSGGGHASMPPRRTSLGLLSQAVSTLEHRQHPLRLTPVPRKLLKTIAPHLPLIQRLAVVNLWLFRPFILRMLSKTPPGNAMLRTTAAPTMAKASDAPNVLSTESWATVNYRMLQGDQEADVIEHVKRHMKDKPITVRSLRVEEASRITDTASPAFQLVSRTISQVFPDAITAPYLMTGGTDSRKYEHLCSGICRFSPYRLTQADIDLMHSPNERISEENLLSSLQFYLQLMNNLGLSRDSRS